MAMGSCGRLMLELIKTDTDVTLHSPCFKPLLLYIRKTSKFCISIWINFMLPYSQISDLRWPVVPSSSSSFFKANCRLYIFSVALWYGFKTLYGAGERYLCRNNTHQHLQGQFSHVDPRQPIKAVCRYMMDASVCGCQHTESHPCPFLCC